MGDSLPSGRRARQARVVSPRNGSSSPRNGSSSPRKGVASPRKGLVSPRKGVVSPRKGVISPRKGVISPRNGAHNKTTFGNCEECHDGSPLMYCSECHASLCYLCDLALHSFKMLKWHRRRMIGRRPFSDEDDAEQSSASSSSSSSCASASTPKTPTQHPLSPIYASISPRTVLEKRNKKNKTMSPTKSRRTRERASTNPVERGERVKKFLQLHKKGDALVGSGKGVYSVPRSLDSPYDSP